MQVFRTLLFLQPCYENRLPMSFINVLRQKSTNSKLVMSMVTSEVTGNVLGPFLPIPFWKAFPKLHDRLVNSVATNVMLPNLDEMQPAMEEMFRSPKKAEEWKAAQDAGMNAKAHFMANEAVNLVSSYPFSFGTAMVTKLMTDRALHVDTRVADFLVGSIAEAVIHLGGMVLLPKIAPEKMAAVKTYLSKTLQNIGMNEQDADSAAMNITYSGLSDVAGFAANLGYQILRHGKGSNLSV
jgi:hypothetical protein